MSKQGFISYNDAYKAFTIPNFQVMAKPIGPLCNLDCNYCYYLEKKNIYPEVKNFRMSDEVLESFIRQYLESQDTPVLNFSWQGGEPTQLGVDFFRKAVELQQKYANGKKIGNALQTNGTLLTDEWCKFFVENDFLVGISIDGPENLHNPYRKYKDGTPSFSKVMKGVELLKKHNVEFNTLTVVNDLNSKYPVEVYDFLKSIGSIFHQYIPIVERIAESSDAPLKLISPDYEEDTSLAPWSVNPVQYGKFLCEIFDKWVRKDVGSCFVQIFDVTLANWVGHDPGLCLYQKTCGNAAVIEHNGDIYSCDHFVYKENYIGNILKSPLTEMMRSGKQVHFALSKNYSLPEKCMKCKFLFSCQGECPKNRIVETDDKQKNISFLCEGLLNFFEHITPAMDFMAEEVNNNGAPANVMQWLSSNVITKSKAKKINKNAPCPCGSGKKYKRCCGSV